VILNRDGGSRRDDAADMPSSVPELGRALRRARTRQGLRLEDVSDRTAVPVLELEALESGTVDRMPDRVQLLKSLRRYADFLGLPGERFVLILIDRWPDVSVFGVAPMPGQYAAVAPSPEPVVAPVTPAEPMAGATMYTRDPATGAMPAVGSDGADVTGTVAAYGMGAASATGPASRLMVDTGVVPKVPRAPDDQKKKVKKEKVKKPKRRRTGAPWGLRLLVVFVALLVVVAVAGLIVHADEPGWWSDLGFNNSHTNHQSTSTTSTTSPVPVFAITSNTPDSATFTVDAKAALISATPVKYESYMHATSSEQAAPVFVGEVPAGQTKDFFVIHTLTLEVGSSSVDIFVKVGNKVVGLFAPKSAPFTMTFTATG
jgi:cytoskeletal protein RodZ